MLKKSWNEAWGVRMEHILRNALLALLDQPVATMAEILPLLDDETFRARALQNIENAQVRRFDDAHHAELVRLVGARTVWSSTQTGVE